MTTGTSVKLAMAGVICIFFAGFVLRAAMRLAAVATHSLFTMVLLLVIALWVVLKTR